MDNILIFSKDHDEHQERTWKILRCLQEHDLYLKAEKCKFDIQEVEFLGLIVRLNQLSMDPTKLSGIKDWPAPTNVKGIWSFLGFGNFYRRFIGHFASLAWLLNDLTKKDVPFAWTKECQEAFDALKDKFSKSLVLSMPDPSKPFMIESDTSKVATGAILRQKDSNSDWHPCGYISHSFDTTQWNYEIYDQELLGIVRALETWRHYLQRLPHLVTIFSNHKNLTYSHQAQKLNCQQAHWSLFLSQFDLKLIHVPGSQMVQFNALSHQQDFISEEDSNNENLTLLPESMFIRTIDTELQDLFAESLMGDDLSPDCWCDQNDQRRWDPANEIICFWLENWRRTPLLLRQMLCTTKCQTKTRDHQTVSQIPVHWPSRTIPNPRANQKRLLVAWYVHLCEELCCWLCHMPVNEG